ncbi:hypothetical protein D3C85_474550 [compost metagenome]
MLLLIEHGGDGGGLEGEGPGLEGLLAAIDPDPGQGQLVEAGKFAALCPLELPVGQGQPALGDLPCQTLLAGCEPVRQLGAGLAPGQCGLEIGGPKRSEGGEGDLAEVELPLAGPGHNGEFTVGLEGALLIECGTQLIAVEGRRRAGKIGQLQGELAEGEGRQPTQAALLAAIAVVELPLGQGQLADAHHQGLAGRCCLLPGLQGVEQGGQGLGQVETGLSLVIRQAHKIHLGGGQGQLLQHQGALLPARFQGGNDLQLFKRHQRLLPLIEQGAGPQGEGGGTQPDLYLPQGELQTIMGGEPARQVALDEVGGLPQQDGEGDEQGGAEIEGVTQQASGQRLEHDGLHWMRTW